MGCDPKMIVACSVARIAELWRKVTTTVSSRPLPETAQVRELCRLSTGVTA